MADYDMDTARAMLETRRYLYVGFMCHQVVEKTLKGYLAELDPFTSIPYIHSLTRLAKFSGLDALLDDSRRDTIDVLDPLNIEARYPSAKDELTLSLTRERCMEIIQRTESISIWIRAKSHLSSNDT